MKKEVLKKSTLGGILWTLMNGTLSHFFYQWSGKNPLAALISPVNESTWEHMKLLFFPMFLTSVVQLCCLGRTYPNFLAVRGVSTLAGTALIPVLFYTYTGVVGRHVMWADIAVFYLSVLGAFALDFVILTVGEMTSFAGLPAWISQLTTVNETGHYQGLLNITMSIGRAIGPLYGGFVIDQGNYQDLFVSVFLLIAGTLLVVFGYLLHLRHQQRISN